MAKLNINDSEILEAIRLGNQDAYNAIIPLLKRLISRKLFYHGLNTKELRDTLLADVLIDLTCKKKPIVVTKDSLSFLDGMVGTMIQGYILPSKMQFMENGEIDKFPSFNRDEEKDEQNILWLMTLPFLEKLPRKSRELILKIHDGQTNESICAEFNFIDKDTLYARKSQAIKALKDLIDNSKGNEWFKGKLRKKQNENE